VSYIVSYSHRSPSVDLCDISLHYTSSQDTRVGDARCQVRKAVLLYKLIIDLKLKNIQIQINLYVVIICSTTVIFDYGSIIIII
jgi:hypothetical protein